jgi:uncharacterized membrane protein
MINMKRNIFLVPFFAVLTLMLVGFASANLANSVDTSFNDVLLGSSMTMAGDVSDNVPVRVTFDADDNATDVRVKVRMEGHRDDVLASTSRFDIVDGVTYTKLLSLDLPSDINDLTKEFTLYVEIVSADDRTEETYEISMQRESYTLEILSVDYSSKVSAGDVFPVSVVLKNVGFNRVDDNYVVVSIPELGVSTRGYAGDLIPTECCEDEECDEEEDSVQKTVYLRIPEAAESGVYELEVEAYNKESDVTVSKLISVGDSGSTVILAAVKNQDMNAGETKTYDLVIVNSADDVKVFNIQAVSGSDLAVSTPSVVTVGPDASETVSVTVTASDDVEIGTYTFSVDVNGRQTVFGVNIVGRSVSTPMVALTVVLIIVFIVLLAVLIVLLTRKEKPIEEVETSYY